MKLEKLGIILAVIIFQLITTPLELSMIPVEFAGYLIIFKVYLFIVAPVVLVKLDSKSKNTT